MKKFNLFLVIAFTLTAFLAGYIMVKRGASVSSETGTILDKFESKKPSVTAPQIEQAGIPIPVTNRRVISVTNSLSRSSILYFEKNTGKLYEYDLNTRTEKTISDKMLPNFISAIWSPTKKEILGSFTSSNGMITKYLNIDSGKEVALIGNIRSAAFSPDGNLIVYYYLNNDPRNESGNIIISQPDGQYQKKVLATRIKDLLLSWPSKESLAFETPGQETFLLSEDGKLTKFLDIKLGLEEKWSPSGDKLLYSALPDDPEMVDMQLWVKDVTSKEEKELIPGLASKCVWSIDSTHIYCAVAKSPSFDDIYLINTIDGSTKLLAEPNLIVKEIFLSTVEDYLLFINTSDEKLYSIKIPD